MLANIIFLAIGLSVGMALGWAFGENYEKDNRISDLKKQIKDDDCAKLPID